MKARGHISPAGRALTAGKRTQLLLSGEAPPNLHHSQGVLARAKPAQRETMWLNALAQLAAVHRVADERLHPYNTLPHDELARVAAFFARQSVTAARTSASTAASSRRSWLRVFESARSSSR